MMRKSFDAIKEKPSFLKKLGFLGQPERVWVRPGTG
jgi:hypothetical protein